MFIQKKEKGKKISMTLSIRPDGTHSCVKEIQGATESVGSCRIPQVLSGGLFSSATLLLRSVSLCILTWSIITG